MAELTPIYDLMLLLRTSADEDRRNQIRGEVEQTIADHDGVIELAQEWGVRNLAFEIDHTRDAEYHLLQFSGPPVLVEALSYNLKIADGVLRHRIIKVLPGTPPVGDPPAGAIGALPPAEPVESVA
ncbi:30S ribosomal protein S6 [Conexibacter sp. CPCC 206217]|uniref:30S ribosomal protein S6 n=1 Tax=Conexibacter sp. CPCC 206217 TaxID=3064574 RepID=UPI00271A0A15|nr:30S ribosomal protein S6 [Conexibacter sp. CPCC 206217]MDO8211499.1 30S ribosomal protein S6 [Conexibacter sp. CPCC 206217]